MIIISGLLLNFTVNVEKENIIVYDQIIAENFRVGFADSLNFNKSKKLCFRIILLTFFKNWCQISNWLLCPCYSNAKDALQGYFKLEKQLC